MATVSSSTSYSASSGLSGLVSNFDTDSMVEKLLSATQAKIDKQNASKQRLSWKQESYRDVISTFKNFQLNFFSFSKPESNLLSNAFFSTMSAGYTSPAIKATATNSAPQGRVTIDYIEKLAKSYKEKAAESASSKINGDIDLNDLKREVKLAVGNTEKTIQLTGDTADEILINLNQSLINEFGENIVSASVSNGALSITAADPEKTVLIRGSMLGLSMLGFSSSRVSKGTINGKIDASKAKATVDITLDGVKKTIELNTEALSGEQLTNDFRSAVIRAFGSGIAVNLSADGKRIEIDAENYRQLSVSGSLSGLSALGLIDKQSNRINLGMKIKDIDFSKQLFGTAFEFTINGTTFTASEDDTLSSIINKINTSGAGVKISYSAIDDKFSIESTATGEGMTVEMSQKTGNFLTVLFGAKSGGDVSGAGLYDHVFEGGPIALDFSSDGGEFKLSVNGQAFTINLPARTDEGGLPLPYTSQEAADYINNELKWRFGVDPNGDANVSFSLIADRAQIRRADGFDVEITSESITELMTGLGFGTAQNSAVSEDTLLGDLMLNSGSINIGGTIINIGELSTVSDLKLRIQEGLDGSAAGGTVIFDAIKGALTITGVTGDNFEIKGADEDGNAALKKLFEADVITFNSAAVEPGELVLGSNAVLMVNGTKIEKNTNSFTLDGINIELLQTTKIDGTEKINIEVSKNTEKIYNGIKSFVEEYNKLLDKLNALLGEAPEYKEYAPLTADQKKEMSEKEIELWEEKAKTGLLRNDGIINNILSEMRSTLYQKPDGAKYALYDLGIITGSWQEKGKLVINDPEKLKNAIENDTGEVLKLFTDTDKGLSVKLNAIIDSAAKSSFSSPGSLVSLAGVKGMVSDSNNSLSKQMKDIDTTIERLNRAYEQEKSRYWKQFNAMEELISKMNQQSGWLMMQFSS